MYTFHNMKEETIMKKRCISLALVLCLILGLSTSASAAGLFDITLTTPEPEKNVQYENALPSYTQFTMKKPDSETTLEDGSRMLTHELVSEPQYLAFGDFLGEMGWNLESYTPFNGGVEVVLAKNEQRFSLHYLTNEYTLQLIYPAGASYADYATALDMKIDESIAEKSYAQAVHLLYKKGGADALKQAHNIRYRYLKEDQIAAGGSHTVGVKADGTVVAVGNNEYNQCNNGWGGIVAVAAGYDHTVGLKADGTVVAVGWNDYKQCNVSDWQDIVAIAAGGHYTVGLKADGTVVAVGDNGWKQCDVSGWKNIGSAMQLK